MKRLSTVLAVLLAVLSVPALAEEATGAADALSSLSQEQVISDDCTPARVLELCRAMVPADVVIGGRVNRRSRHGRTVASYGFVLKRRAGVTELELRDEKGEAVSFEKGGRILDTDLTWNDLAMDFLWWKDVSFDEKAEAESMSGILCKVLFLKQGDHAYRAWIDRRTGAMLQANELVLKDGVWTTVREVFCTSLKKFGERWAPKNIEVGPTNGPKYRTKIVIESVEDLK